MIFKSTVFDFPEIIFTLLPDFQLISTVLPIRGNVPGEDRGELYTRQESTGKRNITDCRQRILFKKLFLNKPHVCIST